VGKERSVIGLGRKGRGSAVSGEAAWFLASDFWVVIYSISREVKVIPVMLMLMSLEVWWKGDLPI
jgi:hypothetical protein